MVLAGSDNHQAAVTIPAGTLIEVLGPVERDDRFLVVRAGDEQFHVFASDLAARAERVSREPARGSTEESPALESDGDQRTAAKAGARSVP